MGGNKGGVLFKSEVARRLMILFHLTCTVCTIGMGHEGDGSAKGKT